METINTNSTSTLTSSKPLVKDAAELVQELHLDDNKTNENFIDIIDGKYC
jgi:hypothetical protein